MPTESLTSSPPRAATITSMVVEDDASVSEILKTWLQEAAEFTCLGVYPDVKSAAPALLQHKPDVVLMDIQLPGHSGIECVRAVKPRLPGTQFVMLTVYEDSNHIFDALLAGATGYLLKTTSREALIAALREVHAGGSPMSSNIARKVVQSLHQPKPRLKITDGLSKRETEVLTLLAQGYLYKETADALGIGLETVHTSIRRIYEKLHVHSGAQTTARFTQRTLTKGMKP